MSTTIKLLSKDIINTKMPFHYAFIKDLDAITTAHSHDFYELFLITHGKIRHIINKTESILEAGNLVFIRPQDVHYYEKISDFSCHLINIAFAKKVLYDITHFFGSDYMEPLLMPKAPCLH